MSRICDFHGTTAQLRPISAKCRKTARKKPRNFNDFQKQVARAWQIPAKQRVLFSIRSASARSDRPTPTACSRKNPRKRVFADVETRQTCCVSGWAENSLRLRLQAEQEWPGNHSRWSRSGLSQPAGQCFRKTGERRCAPRPLMHRSPRFVRGSKYRVR